jgi:biphenyl-2,3-diol 1,2-dioxygenase
MNQDLQVGYLVIDATDPSLWEPFMTETVGLTRGVAKGTYRMDRWQQRFLVRPAAQDDLGAIGLVALNPGVFGRLVDRLKDAGLHFDPGTSEDCRQRGVTEVIRFDAPGNVPVELAHTPTVPETAIISTLVPDGFVTGDQGLGHVVVMVDDPETALRFWTDVVGFAVSDQSEHETPAGLSKAVFLHCNRRHHSVALVRRPERSTYSKRILHFMVQATTIDAVGRAYDRALDAGVPIPRSLGRHPNDQMFSFYGRTPGGFDYEFGWGAVEVDESWQVKTYDHISAWGHRPL